MNIFEQTKNLRILKIISATVMDIFFCPLLELASGQFG